MEAVNVNTNGVYSTETNVAGLYNIPALLPGPYRISVQKEGFEQIVKPGVALHVADIVALNFALEIGSVSQSVTVEGGAPTIELITSSIGSVVNSTTVRELPLNGRDWASLAILQAGVTGIRSQLGTTGSTNRGNRGFGNQLTTDGHRPTENTYRINGINVNDYTNGAPGSVASYQLGVDAIQEFSVLTTNYSAEYGRTSGSIVNAVLKSGTNAFHGDLYGFLRDKGLDSRNFFDKASAFPSEPIWRFGGGPHQEKQDFLFR